MNRLLLSTAVLAHARRADARRSQEAASGARQAQGRQGRQGQEDHDDRARPSDGVSDMDFPGGAPAPRVARPVKELPPSRPLLRLRAIDRVLRECAMSRKILIVEDDAAAAAYLAKGLGEAGYAVEIAPDGRDGLFLASEGSFDLIDRRSHAARARRAGDDRRGPRRRHRDPGDRSCPRSAPSTTASAG